MKIILIICIQYKLISSNICMDYPSHKKTNNYGRYFYSVLIGNAPPEYLIILFILSGSQFMKDIRFELLPDISAKTAVPSGTIVLNT